MAEQEMRPERHSVTTTHAGWGAGHPRLLVASEHERFVHELDCDLTHIGSADDSDVLLEHTDPLLATVTHDATDEYVLAMLGAGATSRGPYQILRSGAQFSAGPWHVVFARDEFADHGRPYGGRQGGEFSHQRPQAPRPDYAKEHPASSLTRCAVKPPDESNGPDQRRALSRAVVSDDDIDAPDAATPDLRLVNDELAGIYEGVLGDDTVGGVTYNLGGDDRVTLLAVSLFPEFRGRGLASELIRGVLDDVRAQGKTVSNYCPVVRSFIDRHPEYSAVIDPEHPGVVRDPA